MTTTLKDFQFDVAALVARTAAEARPYQGRIIKRTLHSFLPESAGGLNLKSIMINSPTGSGKTTIALLASLAMVDHTNCLIGWTAMRRNLLAQAANENAVKGTNLDIDFISMFQSEMPERLLPANRGDRKLLLIGDEGHHEAADSCIQIHKTLKPDYSIMMSGTPYRTDRLRLCYDAIINDAGIAALIQDGYLSPYEHYTIPAWKVDQVVELYLREPKRWGKSIFYWHTIDQARQANDLLSSGMNGKYRPIASELVTGSTDREAQLERFRAGETMTITNCMVLTEGMDVPNLETAFVRPSCKGCTTQMCGRVFRKHESIKFKKIVQCEKTPWPFMRTVDPLCAYKLSDGRWLMLKPNDATKKIATTMLSALSRTKSATPDFIRNGGNRKKSRRGGGGPRE